jgi:hypothetical protein
MVFAPKYSKNPQSAGFLLYIAIATYIRKNQKPNSVRRRFAPPHTIWFLCPNKNGDSYTKKFALSVDKGSVMYVS